MSAPTLPEPRFVETNGIRMGVYEQGTGFPIVFCHGFPELAYSWRYQIPALASAGFRAIAPDQRGYGITEAPKEIEKYSIRHLTDDMAGMLDALGIEKAVFCGHDWGGMVVWQMALRHPDRVAGVIGVNTPFIPRGPMDPIAMMRMAMGEDMYIVFFQKPGVADAALAEDTAKTFRFFMRKGGETAEEYAKRPQEQKNLAIAHAIKTDEGLWPGEALMSDEELDFFIKTFEKTGFTGGINWYRNFTRNWEESADLKEHVAVPALMITAEDDIVLSPAMAEGMEKYVPDLEKHMVKRCGHWTQQEHPEETNRVIVDWMKRKFG